ncbi:unnamed protein product [Mytilus coruscus]|uniref:Retrotransposon gag domain-containing protein n=1 Tax=Mytilus coruscus TaxID=42192 RepID=A0A6J8BJ19_MYTCO|nr:unnamed protein product [Mytilus coruscus]
MVKYNKCKRENKVNLYDSDHSVIADSKQTSTPYREELFGRARQNAWSSESFRIFKSFFTLLVNLNPNVNLVMEDKQESSLTTGARPKHTIKNETIRNTIAQKHDNSEFIKHSMPPQSSHYMYEDHYIGSKVAPNDVRQKGYEYASVYRDTKLPVQKVDMQRPLYERPMHVPPQYDPLRPHIVEPEGYYRLPSRQHERPFMLLSNSVPGSLYVSQRPVGPVGYIEHESLPHEGYGPITTYERSVHDYYGTNPILSGNNRRKQKEPDSFDGKCSEWVDYIIHFEQVASWNQWTDREKAQQLTMCLRGYAQKILSDLTLGQMSDYNALKNVLSQRFNPREGEVAYRCEFRNRRRQKDETVAEYGYGLRRLAQQAYPTIRYNEIEPTVVDQYIHGLNNHELKKHVQFHHPQTLIDKIVKPRETFDAHNIQTLQALTESEPQNSESKILGQISQRIDNKFKEYLNENRTVDTSKNRIGSYNEPNRNEGQARSDFENRPKQIETFKKQVQFADVVNDATTLVQRVNKISCQDREPLCRQEVDTCINVESTTPIVHLNQLSGSCLYVKAEINSTPCKLLVDTGSPVCVISSKLFNTMEIDKTELQKTDTALYTADGTKLVVKGQVNVQVKLGTEIFKQNVIVVNIEELAGILGMDYLEKQDVEIKIGKRVLEIKRQNIPLEKVKCSIGVEIKQSNDVAIPTNSGFSIESHVVGKPEWEIALIEGTNFVKNKGLLLAKSLLIPKPKSKDCTQ